MIKSAVGRLTFAYLAILMTLSLGFTVLLYNISMHELNQEIRQPYSYELVQPGLFLDFGRFRDYRFNEARRNLIENLVVINIGTLILGSIFSYGLAKRNIRPIEEALEAQSRFAADASHELRTPLTALQTEIEVALRDKKLNLKDAKAQLNSNLEEVIKLRTLSDRLLKLARDDEKIEIKKFELQRSVLKSINQVAPLAKNKNIKLVDNTRKMQVLGNAQHTEDCLAIILDNAIKYSPIKTKVTIESGKDKEFGFVTIVDQGSGIKPEELPYIFERFYRADHSRGKDGDVNGHGLGLSIAKNIMEAQNGYIEVISNPDKGSAFTVKLPLPRKK